jgi:hypothetical protein
MAALTGPIGRQENSGGNWLDQEAPATGWGTGNYVEDTAHDRGFPSEPPATLLPDLLDGALPFSRRALRMGRQAVADGIADEQMDADTTST